ncbi:MAG: histidinol-phosphatase [Clostridia bacterium]|nr:histidinol-phosphatase [Clostridia bacterium]
MLSNFHTHTVFCDGSSTAEEVVLSAIRKGFDTLGFSGHGHTPFDSSYCMQDTAGYLRTVRDLARQYKDKLQIFAGVEEDAEYDLNRSDYDYLLGSSHYLRKNGVRYPIDSNPECFQTCLEVFDNDVLALAENYYSFFVDYILRRKPDIIGHFDLITKFDEMADPIFLQNPDYNRLAVAAIEKAAGSGCVFEVNTGAISRGYRTTPYPSQPLLSALLKVDARVVLCSDSHHADTIDFAFDDAKSLLREVGFRKVWTFDGEGFVPYEI